MKKIVMVLVLVSAVTGVFTGTQQATSMDAEKVSTSSASRGA
ncbi:hypothetical protein QUF51_08090 [Bacillus pumilus]|nr:hypothetical protein [Bacillus pumilus]